MPRTPEQEAAAAAHRDAAGNALLVGPDCPACEQRSVARYRCTACPATFEVPGVFRWHWQGLGHWHVADDEPGWRSTVSEHVRAHADRAVILPVR